MFETMVGTMMGAETEQLPKTCDRVIDGWLVWQTANITCLVYLRLSRHKVLRLWARMDVAIYVAIQWTPSAKAMARMKEGEIRLIIHGCNDG